MDGSNELSSSRDEWWSLNACDQHSGTTIDEGNTPTRQAWFYSLSLQIRCFTVQRRRERVVHCCRSKDTGSSTQYEARHGCVRSSKVEREG